MLIKSSLLGWLLLLSFALLGPVALPAGGAYKLKGERYSNHRNGPMVIENSCNLKASPSSNEKTLCILNPGTTFRVLRSWNDLEGYSWLHIEISSFVFCDDVAVANRGWINV